MLDRTDARTEVVGIDEAQFFDAGIVDVVTRLADLGKRVIVAGLDQDYLGKPFDPMPALMADAEDVIEDARDLRPLRGARQPDPAPRRVVRAGRRRSRGPLRGALPALFRAGDRRRGRGASVRRRRRPRPDGRQP